MPNRDWKHLLDMPAFPADRYAVLADRLAALMGTKNHVLLIQAEAVLALEAVATSLARPGLRALNIVTSPYGAWFGGWLTRGGADVYNLTAEPAWPISVDAVRQALDDMRQTHVLSLVHAESASGILNPLEEIMEIARSRGIVTIVDAVASIGGHALDVDHLGIDIAVIGPQKALAGPAGLSAISVSEKAWRLIEHEHAPQGSMLSLMDQKQQWLDTGRNAIPGTPSSIEFFALHAALERIEVEGIGRVQKRHVLATKATRLGLKWMGAAPWVAEDKASALVTTVVVPPDLDTAAFLVRTGIAGAELSAGVGPGAERLIRLNHTGQRANEDAVIANLKALGNILEAQGKHPDIDAALRAASSVYGNEENHS